MMISEDRRSRAHFDVTLCAIVFILAIFGVLAISVATYSTSSTPDAPLLNHIVESTYSMRQGIFLLISPIIIGVMVSLPYDFLRRRSNLFFYISIFILLVVLVTNRAEGVKAWADLIWGFTVQPSEFAKIAMIMLLAKVLARKEQPMTSMREFVQIMLIIALPAVLILAQGEMGTLIVMVFIFAFMLFFGNVSLKLLGSFAAIGVLAILLVYAVAVTSESTDYRLLRIASFLNPELYTQNESLQMMKSMTAVGSGGMNGIGMFVDGSMAQLNSVPEDWTDFIFAPIGEAFGFVGCISIVVLYLLMILRMVYLARFTKDKYGQLVIIGIMSMFLFHIFQNIAMAIGRMPITGIPLPFLSYGGSNMVTNMAGIGLVLNVTKNRSLSHAIITPQASGRAYRGNITQAGGRISRRKRKAD